LFKRILLTAVVGGGLLLAVPGAATAVSHGSHAHVEARQTHPTHQNDFRPDWWDDPFVTPVYYGPYASPYAAPRLIFTGFDSPPDFYYAPPGVGAPSSGFYLPYLTNFYGDEYFVNYGFRCNGYRDGWYFDHDGRRVGSYRHNADCDDYFARHAIWFGAPTCDAYDPQSGYCQS
jgi:hypothetical protein